MLFILPTNQPLTCSQFKLKTQKDKIHFIKEHGICFGCLKRGHISKDCRSRLDCSVCQQKHPSVLHIEQKGISTPFNEAQEPVSLLSVTSGQSQTCGHIGAGDECNAVFSIVAVQVKSQMSDRVVQTYAFLDPGSSVPFALIALQRDWGQVASQPVFYCKQWGKRKL